MFGYSFLMTIANYFSVPGVKFGFTGDKVELYCGLEFDLYRWLTGINS